MTTQVKSRLGRGLDALIGGETPAGVVVADRLELSPDAIAANPFQPRKTFDDDDLTSLSESIANHGILQPLVVRKNGDRYELVAGERRLRAAQLAGLAKVPVTVVAFDDRQSYEAALVENIQRADLNPIEKAVGFREYLDRYGMTHEQLASRLGMARSTVTNLVTLLDLPEALQQNIRTGTLTLGHAKILKGITDAAKQQALAREIIARGLSVHATMEYLTTLNGQTVVEEEEEEPTPMKAPSATSTAIVKTAHVVGIEEELQRKLGMKVEIKVKGTDKGQVVLRFESNDDFERVVAFLRK